MRRGRETRKENEKDNEEVENDEEEKKDEDRRTLLLEHGGDVGGLSDALTVDFGASASQAAFLI